MKQDFKTLTDREHILLRPQMYIGQVDLTKAQEYILEDGKIQLKEVQYVPGLIKIINEVLDNSVDVAIKTNFKHSDKIDVKIDKKSITVKDNGTGIPVQKMDNGNYIPFVAWNSAKSGSNFSDDENRTQIGMNGVGSYQTNCFSKKFTGKTDDGKNAYEVTFKNNAQEFKETLKESKEQGTEVKFFPDLERFGLEEIDSTHIKIIEQRLINLSMSFPEITFKLNGKRVISGSFKKFAEMFGDSPTLLETEKYRYAFLYNPEDDFRHFSYVNGLKIPEGGTHIEAVTEPVVQFMREKLQKRFKGIKPQDIRNKLLVLAFLKDLPNPKFNSQTKEKITNSRGDINAYLGDLDFEKLGNQIHKNKQILEGITEIFKIKEEFKKRQEMKSLSKPKKIKSDKYIPAIKKKKYLFVTEGYSAFQGISPIFERNEVGYYMLKGKPLNTITQTHQKFMSNTELSELYQIIQNEEYEQIVMATDADLDAVSIKSLIAGFIWKMLPEYKDKLYQLNTPVIVVSKNSEPIRWTYTLGESLEPKTGEKSQYMKGLGSWDPEELRKIIEVDGFSNMVQKIDFNEESDKVLLEWLDKDSEPRKKYILANDFSIAKL